MRGTLRVIPSAASQNPNRIISLRQVPSPLLLQELVGEEPMRITTFDTILSEGEAVPCAVYVGRTAKERELPPNTWGNLLWLQAVVRKDGFSEADADLDYLAGPVVIMHGDPEFMDALAA